MRLIGRLFLALVVAIGILATIVIIRTVNFAPPKGAPVDLASGPEINPDIAARHLSEAIQFKTVSHQNPADDDRAEWEKQRSWLITAYPKFHSVAKREVVGDGALLYTWTGSDASLAPMILMAHQDVVPVAADAASLWTSPPFSGAIVDGQIWGRGTLDDKGSLIAVMEAVEALAAQGATPKRTIIIASGQDEEVGGTGAAAIAKLLADRGIKAEFVLDEGLVVLKDNPISGSPAAMIGVTEKGYATLRVSAKAAGGHSSSPPKDLAVRTLAQAIVAITNHPFPMTVKGTMLEGLEQLAPMAPFTTRMAIANAWLFEPLIIKAASATPSVAASLHTTIAPTMLEGSPKENVLPSTAVARINYRLAPGTSIDAVMERARDATRNLDVELAWDREPTAASAVASTDSAAYRTMAALSRDLFGAPSAPAIMIGGTDGRRMEGLTTNIYRFLPIKLKLTDTTMYHGQNEHISVEDLANACRFYGRLMATMAF